MHLADKAVEAFRGIRDLNRFAAFRPCHRKGIDFDQDRGRLHVKNDGIARDHHRFRFLVGCRHRRLSTNDQRETSDGQRRWQIETEIPLLLPGRDDGCLVADQFGKSDSDQLDWRLMTGVSPLDVDGNVQNSSGRVLRGQLAIEMMVQRLVTIGRDPERRVPSHGQRYLRSEAAPAIRCS